MLRRVPNNRLGGDLKRDFLPQRHVYLQNTPYDVQYTELVYSLGITPARTIDNTIM